LLANNYGSYAFPLSKERIELVEYLKHNFPTEFSLYGVGWPECDGNLNSSQYEEAEHYRGSKIAINISHFNYDRYSSDRLLRILGTGVMCLSKRFENSEMRFEDGIHLKYWDSFEQLGNLIKHYLSNEADRKLIAKWGCSLVHSRYTFENLILNIKRLYEQYK